LVSRSASALYPSYSMTILTVAKVVLASPGRAMDSVVILKAWVRTMAAGTLGYVGANKYQLSIGRGSGATVAYQVKQLTQRLIEAFEPLFVEAMPGIVRGHLLGVQEESAYIAADRSAGNLRHPLIVTLPRSRVNRRVGYPSP
jgi:hypothetical protein